MKALFKPLALAAAMTFAASAVLMSRARNTPPLVIAE